LRFQDAAEDTGQGEAYEPLTDRLSEEQIAADNVVIVLVRHDYYWRSPDGRQEILDILLSGSGPAYAFRDGQVYEVEWNRPALDSVLYLTFPDGSDYAFQTRHDLVPDPWRNLDRAKPGGWLLALPIPDSLSGKGFREFFQDSFHQTRTLIYKSGINLNQNSPGVQLLTDAGCV
jgi:hypothetical protein